MKAIRYSGLPVKLEHLESYKSEWTAQFDELKAKHGNDMLSLQSDLANVELELNKKYSVTEEWGFLKTKKAVQAKMAEHGCPILIAQSSENPKELVYVIMDSGL